MITIKRIIALKSYWDRNKESYKYKIDKFKQKALRLIGITRCAQCPMTFNCLCEKTIINHQIFISCRCEKIKKIPALRRRFLHDQRNDRILKKK